MVASSNIVKMGEGNWTMWYAEGLVASSLCSTAHPLRTRFAISFGTSISENDNATEP
jgi:hypothetical protein